MNRKQNFISSVRGPVAKRHGATEQGYRSGNDALSVAAAQTTADTATTPCRTRFKTEWRGVLQGCAAGYISRPIPLSDAMRIQSAEFWLRLDEPLEALAEIESLSHGIRRNRRVHRLHAYALQAARLFQDRSGG